MAKRIQSYETDELVVTFDPKSAIKAGLLPLRFAECVARGACSNTERPPRHAVAVNPLIAFCVTHHASLITQNAVARLNQRCLESGTAF
jgi:hypothetical protein